RLLSRLRQCRAPYRANAVAGLRVSGRAIAAPQRANARRTEPTSAPRKFCELSAEPRPDRQPAQGRAAVSAGIANCPQSRPGLFSPPAPPAPVVMGEEWGATEPF